VFFIHTLFWAGTRPSELLLDLCGGDVDESRLYFDHQEPLSERRRDEDGQQRSRDQAFLPSTVEALKEIKPLNVTDRNGRRIV